MKKNNLYTYVAVVLFFLMIGFGFIIGKGNEADVTNEEKKSEKSEAVTYLDVRTDSEWESGHLGGAVHFELAKLKSGEFPDIPKDSEIEVYCKSGKRAAEATQILLQNNFTNVTNAGGFSDFEKKGEKICYGKVSGCV